MLLRRYFVFANHCEKNNQKSKRLATCSADLCNSKNATACAEQKGYGSIAVNFESAEGPSANSLQQGNKTKNNK